MKLIFMVEVSENDIVTKFKSYLQKITLNFKWISARIFPEVEVLKQRDLFARTDLSGKE